MHRNRSQVTTAAPIRQENVQRISWILAVIQPKAGVQNKNILAVQHAPLQYSNNTYTFLGEMHKYSICQRANSKSICRYFKIRRRYLYCMEVDKHLERFFDGEEYDEFAGSGNMAIKQFNLFKNQAYNWC